MTIFRGFIAVEINTTPEIMAFKKDIAQTNADVKLVETENIHLTLKFLGDTDENQIDAIENIIKDVAQHITPFDITLKGTGGFPNEHYLKVIWIGISGGDVLKTIAHALDEQLTPLGFKKDNKEFSPHLTVGRVRTAKNKDQLLMVIKNSQEKEFSHQHIQEITLKKSDLTPAGPIYTTLRKILL
jgi:RNA 2',3'-cyclic 3'-phosphodiesterase